MRAFLLSAVRHVQLALGVGEVKGQIQGRDVRIVQGIFSGFAGRGVATLVSFISVLLTVRYLGPER